MAALLSWIITHGLALVVGVVIGAGGIKGAEAVVRKLSKGKFFGAVPADTPAPKA